ncbi:hypothetical protein [Hoeflea sp.]|uniref:hypothetical protein n=1 Tax=Hoeflea sp. TaxID=1940281 RepID=UPI003B021EF4
MSTATPSDPPLRAVVAHGHQRIVPVDKCLLLFWIGLRLRSTRHQIVQAHLSSDYEVAFDVMLYCMCREALGRRYEAQRNRWISA